MGINYDDIVNAPLPGGGGQAGQPDVLGEFWGGPPGGQMPYAGTGLTPGIDQVVGQAPQPYFAGDEYVMLRMMTTEDRVRLQQQLVAVGLTSKVLYGELDDATIKGFRSLLGMANRQGEDWRATLGRVATNPDLQQGADEFEPTPYLQPDYATLAQRVKDTFRQQLGRDPDSYEMQQLTAELSGFDALAHEREQELNQLAFTQQQTPGVQGGGTVEAVDPMSRFQELFERNYKHELDFVEDKKSAVTQREAVQTGANVVSQAARSRF